MEISSKNHWDRNFLILILGVGILLVFLPVYEPKAQNKEVEFNAEEMAEKMIITQGNSLIPLSDPSGPEPEVVQKITVVVTAYSSTPMETDEDPYITAAGTWVRDGIVANNFLPFGTKIRIPELYGEKVFVVEDRMNWKKGNYHIDIWFASYWDAKEFGVKKTYVEILES